MFGEGAVAAAENEKFVLRFFADLMSLRLRPEDRAVLQIRITEEDEVGALAAAHPPHMHAGWTKMWKRHVQCTRATVRRVLELNDMAKVKEGTDLVFFIAAHKPELEALHAKFWQTKSGRT